MNGLTELARFIDPHLGRSQERLDDAVGAEDISEIYNWAGDEYGLYAGGDSKRLFCFAGLQAYADRHLWEVLEKKLNEFRAAGRGAIKLLDARCAPGAWLRRCVTHAYRLSFSQIAARGFDAARVQIETAHRMTASLAALPGIDLTFEVADITDPLPGADASVDRAHRRFSNSATSVAIGDCYRTGN